MAPSSARRGTSLCCYPSVSVTGGFMPYSCLGLHCSSLCPLTHSPALGFLVGMLLARILHFSGRLFCWLLGSAILFWHSSLGETVFVSFSFCSVFSVSFLLSCFPCFPLLALLGGHGLRTDGRSNVCGWAGRFLQYYFNLWLFFDWFYIYVHLWILDLLWLTHCV